MRSPGFSLAFMIKFGYNARCHLLNEPALSEYKTRSWAEAVQPSANLCYVRPFPGLLSSFFFRRLKEVRRNTRLRLVFVPTFLLALAAYCVLNTRREYYFLYFPLFLSLILFSYEKEVILRYIWKVYLPRDLQIIPWPSPMQHKC